MNKRRRRRRNNYDDDDTAVAAFDVDDDDRHEETLLLLERRVELKQLHTRLLAERNALNSRGIVYYNTPSHVAATRMCSSSRHGGYDLCIDVLESLDRLIYRIGVVHNESDMHSLSAARSKYQNAVRQLQPIWLKEKLIQQENEVHRMEATMQSITEEHETAVRLYKEEVRMRKSLNDKRHALLIAQESLRRDAEDMTLANTAATDAQRASDAEFNIKLTDASNDYFKRRVMELDAEKKHLLAEQEIKTREELSYIYPTDVSTVPDISVILCEHSEEVDTSSVDLSSVSNVKAEAVDTRSVDLSSISNVKSALSNPTVCVDKDILSSRISISSAESSIGNSSLKHLQPDEISELSYDENDIMKHVDTPMNPVFSDRIPKANSQSLNALEMEKSSDHLAFPNRVQSMAQLRSNLSFNSYRRTQSSIDRINNDAPMRMTPDERRAMHMLNSSQESMIDVKDGSIVREPLVELERRGSVISRISSQGSLLLTLPVDERRIHGTPGSVRKESDISDLSASLISYNEDERYMQAYTGDGMMYWVDRQTNATSWEDPRNRTILDDVSCHADGVKLSECDNNETKPPLPDDWEEIDDGLRIYYHNIRTRETLWELPMSSHDVHYVENSRMTRRHSLQCQPPSTSNADGMLIFWGPICDKASRLTSGQSLVVLRVLFRRIQESNPLERENQLYVTMCSTQKQDEIIVAALFNESVTEFNPDECSAVVFTLIRAIPGGLVSNNFYQKFVAGYRLFALLDSPLRQELADSRVQFWDALVMHIQVLISTDPQPLGIATQHYCALFARVLAPPESDLTDDYKARSDKMIQTLVDAINAPVDDSSSKLSFIDEGLSVATTDESVDSTIIRRACQEYQHNLSRNIQLVKHRDIPLGLYIKEFMVPEARNMQLQRRAIIISHIAENSIGANSELMPGDELLKVFDKSTEHMELRDIMELLHSAESEIVLEVFGRDQEMFTMPTKKSKSLNDNLNNNGMGASLPSHLDHFEFSHGNGSHNDVVIRDDDGSIARLPQFIQRTITIEKKANIPMGLFIRDGTIQDVERIFVVTRLLMNSAAAKAELVKVNDEIVSVNGTPLAGLSEAEAQDLISSSQGQVIFKLRRSDDRTRDDVKIDSDIFKEETVVLKRQKKMMGILVAAVERMRNRPGIFVVRVLPNGLAARNTLLQSGDEIVSINGVLVGEQSLDSVTTRLRDETGQVNIVVNSTTEVAATKERQSIDPLVDMLLCERFDLLRALLAVEHGRTKLAVPLLHLFEYEGLGLDLLREATAYEITHTLHPRTLFRGNSLTTNMISLFIKNVGQRYLIDILGPTIAQITEHPDRYELNADLILKKQDKTVRKNLVNVATAVQTILNNVMNRVSTMPISFRVLCNYIHSTAIPALPGMEYRAVTSFLFLRLICAAIASPYDYGIVLSKPEALSCRSLISVSKLLNAVVNGRPIDPSSDVLQEFNQLFDANKQPIIDLVDTIVVIPDLEDIEASPMLMENLCVTAAQRRQAVAILRSHIAENMDVIVAALRDQVLGVDLADVRRKQPALVPAVEALSRPSEYCMNMFLQAMIVRRVLKDRAINIRTNPVLHAHATTISVRKKKRSWRHRFNFGNIRKRNNSETKMVRAPSFQIIANKTI